MGTSPGDRRARFRALHERERLFVMPNPWDVGSARLLESCGFEALATTSAGFAWSLGKLDQSVSRDELIAHVASLADATTLPLNVDSERFDDIEVAAERVALASEAAGLLPDPMVLTGRAENHIRGVEDFEDTIARLIAYRAAGADAVYAPGLIELEQIAAVVEAVDMPVNVLALPNGPTIAELASVGVRRVSTGSLLARSAYGALMSGAHELLADGTSHYAERGVSPEALRSAFG